MNREYNKTELKGKKLPLTLDSATDTEQAGYEKYFVEYDGLHFEGATIKSVMNRVLKYIFKGGKE